LCFPGGKTPDVGSRTYTEIMKEQLLRGEENDVSRLVCLLGNLCNWCVVCCSVLQLRKKIQEKSKDGTLKVSNGDMSNKSAAATAAVKKRGRWDQGQDGEATPAKKKVLSSTWDKEDASVSRPVGCVD
jgi:splicing factor 3B subunit 1